jgi:hypothetical protein
MNKLILFIVLFFSFNLFADYPKMVCNKNIIVALIDSGFNFNYLTKNAKLCRFGHKDFSGVDIYHKNPSTIDMVPTDAPIGHGTHMEGIIEQYNEDFDNYCIVIIKFLDTKIDNDGAYSSTEAIKYATKIGADYINFSGGGTLFSLNEQIAVKKYLDKGGIFIAAAGNEGANLIDMPFYPAMDDPRVIVVGNLSSSGTRYRSSNYGNRVDMWEMGVSLYSYGKYMTGTSVSAAIATGKILNNNKNCKKNYLHSNKNKI